MSLLENKTKNRCKSELYLLSQDEEGNDVWTKVRCSNVEGMCNSLAGTEHSGRTTFHGFVHWSDQDALESLREYRDITVCKSDKALTGWRAWRPSIEESGYKIKADDGRYIFTEEDHFLLSTAMKTKWTGPVMTTRGGSKVSPEFNYGDSRAGVFSYKTLSLLDKYFEIHKAHWVYGRVDLTGHVVEHELGYRAQKCTIRELWVPRWAYVNSKVLKNLEQRYQCDVHAINLDQLGHMIRFYDSQEVFKREIDHE